MPLVPRSRTTGRALLCWFATSALHGCSSTLIVPPSGPVPLGEAEVAILPEGADALVARLGPRVTTLEGTIVAHDDSALTLVVTRVARSAGASEAWPSERLAVPTSAVRTVRVRRVSIGRTLALAGGAAIALVLIGRNVGSGGSDGSSHAGGEPGK